MANAVTEGLFQANLADFFTGRQDGKYNAGADGSFRITLPELLGMGGSQGWGGTYAAGKSFESVLKYNIRKNGGRMILTAIAAPAVAAVATKMLRKPVILPANRLLKSTGLDVKLG